MDMITLAMAKTYTDRFLSSKEETRTLFRATLENLEGIQSMVQAPGAIGLVPGNTYSVTMGNNTYTATAKTIYVGDYSAVVLGNASLTNPEEFPDSGESYVVVEVVADGNPIVVAIDKNCAETCAVTETIHPIDPKFLPGVCLPVVELSTPYPIDDSAVELTADECALINGAIANSAYFLARLSFAKNPEIFSAVLFCVNDVGGFKLSAGSFASKTLYISTDGELAIYGV